MKLHVHHAFIPSAVVIMAIAAVVNPGVAFIALISCLGMVACDLFGVLLGVSENRGQDVLAGYGDMGSDFFGKYILAGWSGSTLTHGHGIIGWVAIWPVLVTGFFTTGFATRWARRIQSRG